VASEYCCCLCCLSCLCPVPACVTQVACLPPVVGLIAGSVRQRPNPAASWLQKPSWQQLLHLSALPAFAGIADAVAADPPAWQAVYNAPEPQKATLPGLYSRLEEFRKPLVLRCVHSGRGPLCLSCCIFEPGTSCMAPDAAVHCAALLSSMDAPASPVPSHFRCGCAAAGVCGPTRSCQQCRTSCQPPWGHSSLSRQQQTWLHATTTAAPRRRWCLCCRKAATPPQHSCSLQVRSHSTFS
jgi:hypothetical protein